MQNRPCDEALSAVPGDRIFFLNPDGNRVWETVKRSFWQSAPKGGKVYSYETTLNSVVSNEQVESVEKLTSSEPLSDNEIAVTKQLIESEEFGNLIAKQKLHQLVSRTGISPSLQTVICCILDGDAANLEVAAFLLNKRIRELQELESASNSPLVK